MPLWIRRFPVRILVAIRCVHFQILSLTRRSFAFDEAGLPISVATHGRRERWLHLTLESIMTGAVKPSAIFIWRDDDAKSTPKGLRRLEKCGVTLIRLDRRHRSHKKWFGPATFQQNDFSGGVVLADDDLIYPKNWLAELQKISKENPENIVAWRCKSIRLETTPEGKIIAPYRTWHRQLGGITASHLNFATSGFGTYIPPSLLKTLAQTSSDLEHIRMAPTSDDIWLHFSALRARVATLSVSEKYLDWPQNPFQGVSGLADENVGRGKNDEIVSACYNSQDIYFLIGADGGLG